MLDSALKGVKLCEIGLQQVSLELDRASKVRQLTYHLCLDYKGHRCTFHLRPKQNLCLGLKPAAIKVKQIKTYFLPDWKQFDSKIIINYLAVNALTLKGL